MGPPLADSLPHRGSVVDLARAQDLVWHIVAQMPFVGLLGFVCWKLKGMLDAERAERMDAQKQLLDLSRSMATTSERMVTAINNNTSATDDQAEETRTLTVRLESLLQKRR